MRKSLAPEAGARKAASANNDADETPRPRCKVFGKMQKLFIVVFQ